MFDDLSSLDWAHLITFGHLTVVGPQTRTKRTESPFFFHCKLSSTKSLAKANCVACHLSGDRGHVLQSWDSLQGAVGSGGCRLGTKPCKDGALAWNSGKHLGESHMRRKQGHEITLHIPPSQLFRCFP